jgi:hypothetical protein
LTHGALNVHPFEVSMLQKKRKGSKEKKRKKEMKKKEQ